MSKKITKHERKLIKKIPIQKEYMLDLVSVLKFNIEDVIVYIITIVFLLGFSKEIFFNLFGIFLAFVLFVIPNTILAINHIRNTKVEKLSFYPEKEYLVVYKKENEIKINYDEIKNVTKVFSNAVYRAPWKKYSYSIINLKNGEEIPISCLLIEPSKLTDFLYNYIGETKWEGYPKMK